MSMFWKIALAAVIIVGVRLAVFTVDASEFAYVTVLGRHVATYDGYNGGAGLYVGWPWPIQVVQRLDRRIQQFDLPTGEHLTRDAENRVDKNLSVDTYVVWRIQDQEAVNRFVTRIGTEARVGSILKPRIINKIGDLISQKRMDEIVNTKKGIVDEKLRELHRELKDSLQEQVLREYGIELIDIRLRRFNYPKDKETSKSIFDRIISERQKKAEDYRAEGELQAQNIKSKAEEDYRTRLAQAKLEEERLKGQADAEAMRVRNEAYRHDVKFYEFLKEMEKLQSILSDNRAVLLLSTHRPLFQRLFNPPQPGMIDGKPPANPEVSPSKGGQ